MKRGKDRLAERLVLTDEDVDGILELFRRMLMADGPEEYRRIQAIGSFAIH